MRSYRVNWAKGRPHLGRGNALKVSPLMCEEVSSRLLLDWKKGLINGKQGKVISKERARTNCDWFRNWWKAFRVTGWRGNKQDLDQITYEHYKEGKPCIDVCFSCGRRYWGTPDSGEEERSDARSGKVRRGLYDCLYLTVDLKLLLEAAREGYETEATGTLKISLGASFKSCYSSSPPHPPTPHTHT